MAEKQYKLKDLYEMEEQFYIKRLPLKTIIREAVHAYAKEPYQNIIINDIDDYGLEQLTYKGDEPLYALRNRNTEHFTQLFFKDQNTYLKSIVESADFIPDILVKDLTTTGDETKIKYYKNEDGTSRWVVVGSVEEAALSDDFTSPEDSYYTIVKFEFGDDIGYRITDLTYAGDLVSSIGDTIITILDKIKTMLGDFEYFYDLDGRFIFQRKPNYVNTAWSQFVNNTDETYVTYGNDKRRFQYSFEGNKILTAIQNSPVLTNARNDFVVWGKRKSVSGADLPIHARYAIDKKPMCYMTLGGVLYYTEAAAAISNTLFYGPLIDDLEQHQNLRSLNINYEQLMIDDGTGNDTNNFVPIPIVNLSIGLKVDWREIIYQMALDYFAGQGCSQNSPIKVAKIHKDESGKKINLTKFRQLKIYEEQSDDEYIERLGIFTLEDLNNPIIVDKPDEILYYIGQNNPDFYPTGYTGYEQYYTDMQGFWRQLYNPEYEYEEFWEDGTYEIVPVQIEGSSFFVKEKQWVERKLEKVETQYYLNKYMVSALERDFKEGKYNPPSAIEKYILTNNLDDFPKRVYWNINVFEQPETLNFWIDFLDDENELAAFSIRAIGDRTKVINDDKVTAIIFKEIPDIILCPKIILNDNADEEDYSQWKCDASSLKNDIGTLTGYTFVYIPQSFLPYFDMSFRNTSAKNKIDDLVFQYAYCIENISLTSIPVYTLQPNTRIYVRDELSKINGEYLVSKYSTSLAYNGTMSISATKAPERLY